MLVLLLRPKQFIDLDTSNGNIRVFYVRETKDGVKLGFVAPPSVPIVRSDAVAREAKPETLTARRQRR